MWETGFLVYFHCILPVCSFSLARVAFLLIIKLS